MTTSDIRASIASCESLDELETLVRKTPGALDVVFDICEHWIYETLVLRIEGE